ncbi:MAG TPA: hypothetical protein ENN45_02890 [Bacteroidetes bacterium]|nr:hypothetical protein [Bacteroidota bacterium]
MIKTQIRICFFFILLFTACQKDFGEVNTAESDYIYGKGLFIVNEGMYGQGNASISFYSFETNNMYNAVFYTANQRPLGDVATSMLRNGEYVYIVLNNSAKIEIVRLSDFVSVKSISLNYLPLFITAINENYAYLSNLSYPGFHLIDLKTAAYVQDVYTGKSTQQILAYQDYCFFTNWSNYYITANNNTVQRIDTQTNQLHDSIIVGKEPNSMVLDKYNKIWVLSSGGYLGEEYPRLVCFNPLSLQKEKELVFPFKSMSPKALCVNPAGDSLFFLNTSVYAMSVNDSILPTQAFIEAGTRNFYAMSIAPDNRIFLSDALDYQQNGDIYIYSSSAKLLHQSKAGIIPSFFYFVE